LGNVERKEQSPCPTNHISSNDIKGLVGNPDSKIIIITSTASSDGVFGLAPSDSPEEWRNVGDYVADTLLNGYSSPLVLEVPASPIVRGLVYQFDRDRL